MMETKAISKGSQWVFYVYLYSLGVLNFFFLCLSDLFYFSGKEKKRGFQPLFKVFNGMIDSNK